MAKTAIIRPQADLLTPKVQQLVGELLTETSREDANSLFDYIEMIQCNPVLGAALELKILIGLDMLGEYTVEDETHQEFIRNSLEKMRGSLPLSVAELLSVGPLGFAVSEWAPCQRDGSWHLDGIQILDPRKYRFEGKRGSIENVVYSSDQGEIDIPYDRCIHLTNQSYISFGSPYGVAECKRAIAAYKAWRVVSGAALIAAKRRGEPVVVGFADSSKQVQIGTDADGNPTYITATQSLLQALQGLENNSVAATDLANRVETIQAAEGGILMDVLKMLERYMLMAFLVPESILTTSGVGDSNLNTGHRTILKLTVGSVMNQIKERLIEDVVRPLLVWEFGESVTDYGSFPTPHVAEDGAIEVFQGLVDAVLNGIFPATDLDVVNRMRTLAGLPTVTEILEPLNGAPTEPGGENNTDPTEPNTN